MSLGEFKLLASAMREGYTPVPVVWFQDNQQQMGFDRSGTKFQPSWIVEVFLQKHENG